MFALGYVFRRVRTNWDRVIFSADSEYMYQHICLGQMMATQSGKKDAVRDAAVHKRASRRAGGTEQVRVNSSSVKVEGGDPGCGIY